jgi:hypothetical protein
LAPDDATWEDAAFLNKTFPGHKLFRLEDKAQVMAAALSGPDLNQGDTEDTRIDSVIQQLTSKDTDWSDSTARMASSPFRQFKQVTVYLIHCSSSTLPR